MCLYVPVQMPDNIIFLFMISNEPQTKKVRNFRGLDNKTHINVSMVPGNLFYPMKEYTLKH